MVDLLCLAKERAIAEKWVNPHLFTWATLTGHACIAFECYTGLLDNGPAAAKDTAKKIMLSGHLVGDPCELSSIGGRTTSLPPPLTALLKSSSAAWPLAAGPLG